MVLSKEYRICMPLTVEEVIKNYICWIRRRILNNYYYQFQHCKEQFKQLVTGSCDAIFQTINIIYIFYFTLDFEF